MHDIGKAFPGEHSRNGVEIADMIFEDFPLSYRYRSLVKFLIKNHLLMSHVSRRSDIQSQEVILDLADKFIMSPYPRDYLDFLYLLTYSDVLATNPTNFTGYTSALLRQLYHRTRESLSSTGQTQSEDSIISEMTDKISKIKKTQGIDEYLKALGSRYILHNTPQEIIDDYENVRKTLEGEISVAVSNYNEVLEVKIHAPDHIGLFAQIAGILLIHGANITRANIYTFDKAAFDVFYITDIFGANLTKDNMQAELESWIERLKQSLKKFMDDDPLLKQRISELRKRFKPLPEIFFKEGNITITARDKTEYLIGVSGSDRPALLYDLCIYFGQHDMTIRSAIIDTVGWHVKDVFVLDTPIPLEDSEWERHKMSLTEMLNKRD